MAAGNATIAALKVSLGLDSAEFETGLRDASATMQREAARQAKAADQLKSRLVALKSSLDPVYEAQQRVGRQMKEAQDLYSRGALAGAEYGRIMSQLSARLRTVSASHDGLASAQRGAAQSSKALQLAGLNLSRQFTDIGVQLAGGQSPFLILTQQGPQIADAFQVAKAQGLGFSQVVKGIGGQVSGALNFLTPFRLALGGIAAASLVAVAAQLKYADSLAHLGELTEGVGRQSGLAAGQIRELANANAGAAGTSVAQAEALAQALLKTGKVGGDVFGELIRIQKRYALATGQDLKAAQTELAASFADPVRGAQNLQDRLSGLDGQTKQLVTTLTEQGRVFEAQKVLAAAYEAALGGVEKSSQTLGGQLSTLASGFSNLASSINQAVANAKLFVTLGPELYRQLKRQSEAQAQSAQGKAAVNNASVAASDLFLRLNPDANARKELDANVSVAARGLAAAQLTGDFKGMLQSADALERATRAQQTYIPLAERQHRLSLLDAQAKEVEAKKQTAATRAKLADIAAEKKRLELAGQPLSRSEVELQVRDAQNLRASQSIPKSGPRDASEQAVDQATRAEIAARAALTRDIEQVASIKREEIAAELKAQTDRVNRGVAEGSIDKASAAIAKQKYAEAAASKQLLADIEKQAALAQRDLAQREAVGASLDRIASAQLATAASAQEAGRIELEALARRQQLERDELSARTSRQVALQEISATMEAEQTIELLAAQLAERLAAQRAVQVRIIQQSAALEQQALGRQRDALQAQANLLTSGFARAVIAQKVLELDQKIELSKAEEAVAVAATGSVEKLRAEAELAALRQRQGLEKKFAQSQTRLVNAIGDAVSGVRGFKDAFKRHDWAGILDELQRTIQTIKASFAANGLSGGLLTAGSAAATLIGGKGGRIAGNALGIAGLGLGLGSLATGASLGSVGLVTGLTGSAALGGAFGSGLAAIGAAAPPLALAAAALYAAAKIFNIGGKPSNKGAGYDLVTGAITGKSRDAETEQAAVAAGDAIKGIQDALKAAGIGLTDAVTGLVIGTRDQTQIYLQSGKTLRSAVGDSAAAVDAAMKALLEGANYASDLQKKLVEGALAAGKGFDAIADLLSRYEAAQGIGQALADQIQQLKDPKAFDIESVKRDIAAQRKAYQGLVDEGLITTEMLAGFNAQLTELEALKLNDVMKRYAESITSANDNTLKNVTDAAAQNVLEAYSAFEQAKKAEIDQLRQAADSLKGFRRELNIGAIAGRNPRDQLAATQREFQRISGLAPTDPERLANLQSISQAFLEANRGGARNELEAARNLAAVRRATEASETAATAQADVAQQQLDTQAAMLTQLGLLTGVSQDLSTSIKAYLVALKNQTNAGIANDNGLDVNRYLAANPDLVANYQAGGILTTLGSTLEDAARAHYANYGRAEIAKGLRMPGFAKGGSFTMGGSGGIDSKLAQFWMSPGETASITHGDPMEGFGKGLAGLRSDVHVLTGGVVSLIGYARRSEKKIAKWDGDGLPAERVV